MRLGLLIFLFFAFTHLVCSQSLLERRIDFSADQLSMNDALIKLSQESNIPISFNPNLLKRAQTVSIHKTQEPLKVILTELLAKSTVGYRIIGEQIILYKKKPIHFNMSGYLEDHESGERLIAARVYCPELKIGAITNEYGFYSLNLKAGEWDIVIYHIGYKTEKERISIPKSFHRNISLMPNLSLPEIVISPENANSSLPNENDDGSLEITPTFIQSSPSLGGERDLFRTAQLIPGIQGGIDGLGGMHVRGGESGHNLMLLDGVPVYIPFHLLGFYSIYNSSAIRSAKVLKGNFSGRYGGRLASVLDVRMREGNNREIQGEFTGNLITAKGLLEGPIHKGKGSFMISGRSSHSGFLLNPSLQRIFFQSDEDTLGTSFLDINAKINYTLSEKDRLYLSFFHGQDDLEKYYAFEEEGGVYGESELEVGWNNTIAALRWNHLFNSKLFANTTLTYSNYNFEYTNYVEYSESVPFEIEEFFFINSGSSNRDIGLKLDFDYIPNARHTIRFGLGVSDRKFRPSLSYYEDEYEEFDDFEEYDKELVYGFVESEAYEAQEANAYFEDDIQLSSKLKLRLGARMSSFLGEAASFFRFEPRLFLKYKISDKWEAQASINRMVQYLHLISSSSIRLPNDVWLPSSNDILPAESWQTELGIRFHPAEELSLGIDLYHKYMNNLYTYPDDFEFLGLVNEKEPAEYILKGEGDAYGLEFFLNYHAPKTGGILSYTLAQTNRRFDNQNLSLKFPHAQDARHQFKIYLYHKFNQQFEITANWVLFSAMPRVNIWAVSSGEGLLNLDLNPDGERNALRAKAYQRLDITANFKFQTNTFTHQLSAGVYNAYNRQNIIYYELEFDEKDEVYQGGPLFSIPIMPSFSYSVNF